MSGSVMNHVAVAQGTRNAGNQHAASCGPSDQRLEVIVESTRGGTCAHCAVTGGRFDCTPASEREWRYTDSHLDLVVSVRRRHVGAPRVPRALVLVEAAGRVHACAEYYGQPLGGDLWSGPQVLKLATVDADCDFAFPPTITIGPQGRAAADQAVTARRDR